MIKGGYYIKARKTQESEIAHASPCTREIWDWFLLQANHQSHKKDGQVLERGQLMCRYEDILNALHWRVGWRKMRYSKWECERALKALKKATMIATKKTTRGMIVTVLNYDHYQNPANYEGQIDKQAKKATVEPQTTDTIDKNVKNERKKKKKFVPPTVSQINEYCKEKNIYVNAQKFINHYGAKGWMIGKSKMKDWQLAVGNAVDWDCNRLKQPPPKASEKDKIEKIKKEKQQVRNDWEPYLRDKTTPALRDLLKDKKSKVYYFASWLIKEILTEREGKE